MGTIFCRQQQGTFSQSGEKVFGTKGTGEIVAFKSQRLTQLDGTTWKYDGEKTDMYQIEHNEFFASIRAGKPLNFGEQARALHDGRHPRPHGRLHRPVGHVGGCRERPRRSSAPPSRSTGR